MGIDEWGAVWRLLVVCVGAGGSIVVVFWGLMLLFKPVAENAAAVLAAIERLSAAVTGGAAGHGTVGAVAQG